MKVNGSSESPSLEQHIKQLEERLRIYDENVAITELLNEVASLDALNFLTLQYARVLDKASVSEDSKIGRHGRMFTPRIVYLCIVKQPAMAVRTWQNAVGT